MADVEIDTTNEATTLDGTERIPIKKTGSSPPYEHTLVSTLVKPVNRKGYNSWRVRQVGTHDGTHDDDGFGVSELRFLMADGTTNLCTGGTPIGIYPDTAGGWSLAEAFDGSTAATNGYYSGTNNPLAWVGYDFGAATLPAKVSLCPLNAFLWSMGASVAVEYEYSAGVWITLCILELATGVANTFQTFDLPNEGAP